MDHILKRFVNSLFTKQGYIIAHNMERVLGRKRRADLTVDFVRLSSLELIAEEINSKQLEGNVAELGVFRGEFARYINKHFPGRKLFLFDTFEGFSKKDEEYDKKNQLTSIDQDFSDTSENIVLSKMQTPENCIIRKGYFPDTAVELLHEKFVFVSIDPDLYNPVYNGLTYFYPRLVKGGYIFVHDYNNLRYQGVKKAVTQYCTENEIAYFPLSDSCGSAVISK